MLAKQVGHDRSRQGTAMSVLYIARGATISVVHSQPFPKIGPGGGSGVPSCLVNPHM